MEIKDIIEGLNKYYESFDNRDKGVFVLHKVIEDNPIVKSQKIYKASIWYIDGTSKDLLVQTIVNYRVTNEIEISQMEAKLVIKLIYSLLEFTNSIKFKNMCDGKYTCK